MDTSIMVAGLRSANGASAACIRQAAQRWNNVVSVPLLLEYEAVATRPDVLSATRMTRAEVRSFIDDLSALSHQVSPTYSWRPLLRDPDDDMVLETALAGRASIVVTFNLRDFVGAERFGVRVMRPSAALEMFDVGS